MAHLFSFVFHVMKKKTTAIPKYFGIEGNYPMGGQACQIEVFCKQYFWAVRSGTAYLSCDFFFSCFSMLASLMWIWRIVSVLDLR